MIINTAYASMLRKAMRIDAWFHSDKGNRAYLRVQNGPWRKVRLGDLVGDRNIWAPSRFSRVYASDPRYGKPYLVPYDTIRYVPRSNQYLSRSQTKDFESYEVSRGWLLITCSGRNLGPCVWVDGYLERFVVSHDMIRVTPNGEESLFFAMAFLHTPTGQQLIRRDKNGSVIDHIGPDQVRELPIPLVDDNLVELCIQNFKAAVHLREKARLTLDIARVEFLQLSRLAGLMASLTEADHRRRFEMNASDLGWRVDVEPHAPIYETYRRITEQTGCELNTIAEVYKPHGRYKTYYVEDERHGVRLLSGRQIAQHRPIGLKFMSPTAFDNPDDYRIEPGWILMTSDGRAEESLADCVLVTEYKNGWAASGHVHRIKPKPDIHPGILYLACSSDIVQAQIKALATGSVVDALSQEDLARVSIPYPRTKDAQALGDKVTAAWQDFAYASRMEDEATAVLERELLEQAGAGVEQPLQVQG